MLALTVAEDLETFEDGADGLGSGVPAAAVE